jgi:imidazolonepropionase-like amidohydrolase
MYALRAARLIDGTGLPAIADGVVHVDGKRITFAGPASTAPPAPPTAEIIDLGPRTLLPGLIDCHAHPIPWPEGRAEQALPWADQLRVLHATSVLQRTLRSGVTTIRDCGAPRHTAYAVKDAVEQGYVPGPRLIVAGAIICPTGGHGHLGDGEADGPDGVRREARTRFRDGADFLKLTATGGGTARTVRHRATFTVEELRAAVDEGIQHESYATAHVHGTEGMIRCLDAGMPMLEHATFVGPDNREHFDRSVAARIRDQNVIVVPTVQVYGRWAETSPGRIDNLSPDEVEEWRARYESLPCQLYPFPRLDRFGARELATWRHRFDSFFKRVDLVGRLYEAGVVMLMGSDGGGRPAPIDDLGHGIELHVRAGVPPLQAIHSATGLAAKWIRIDGVTGTLEAGKEADVIAVDGDPLTDITATSRVEFVMARGQIVKAPAGAAPERYDRSPASKALAR